MGAACTTMFTSLAAGVVIRGSIDVGLAMELGPSDLYWPVLHQVYRLEQNVAQYPRIVVGDGLIRYLHYQMSSTGTDSISATNREMARQCLSLVCNDVDGVAFMDFLGPSFRKTAGETITPDLMKKCFDFATSQYDKFVNSRDQKHAIRYHLLLQYLSDRINNAAGDI
jgi:hypothetical protein